MANIAFTLEDGLIEKGITHKDVEMRDLTAGDVLSAVEEATGVYMTALGPVLLAQDEKVAVNGLLKIITKLGDIKIPLSRIVFDQLSARDMDMLLKKYMELRGAGSAAAAAGRPQG